jgi:hypothetical protein
MKEGVAREPVPASLRDLPVLDTWAPRSSPIGTVPALIGGVAIGVFALLNLPRLPGLAVAIAVGFVGLARLGRPTVRPALVGALTFGCTALAIMLQQRANRFGPDFGWPQQFADLHVWGVVALLLLAGDYVWSALRRSGPDNEID